MAAFGREAWRPWGAGRLAGVNSGENGRREAETGNVGDARGSFKNLPPSLPPILSWLLLWDPQARGESRLVPELWGRVFGGSASHKTMVAPAACMSTTVQSS